MMIYSERSTSENFRIDRPHTKSISLKTAPLSTSDSRGALHSNATTTSIYASTRGSITSRPFKSGSSPSGATVGGFLETGSRLKSSKSPLSNAPPSASNTFGSPTKLLPTPKPLPCWVQHRWPLPSSHHWARGLTRWPSERHGSSISVSQLSWRSNRG